MKNSKEEGEDFLRGRKSKYRGRIWMKRCIITGRRRIKL